MEMFCARLFSSTNASGHTMWNSSSFVTKRPVPFHQCEECFGGLWRERNGTPLVEEDLFGRIQAERCETVGNPGVQSWSRDGFQNGFTIFSGLANDFQPSEAAS